jgi:ribonucrease Y
MHSALITIIFAVLFLGLIAALFLYTMFVQNISRLHKEREELLETKAQLERETEVECRDMLLRAKDEAISFRQSAQDDILKLRSETEQEIRDRRGDLLKMESRVAAREEALETLSAQMSIREQQLTSHLAEREKAIGAKQNNLDQDQQKLDEARQELQTQLASLGQLTPQEARELLLREVESDIRMESLEIIHRVEDETRLEADRRARNIVTSTIQRVAVQQVSETTISIVALPSEDLKGRIIGKEGRNIRAFETITGVDLIIDDTPEAVVLSSFDPVRREVAKLALKSLIDDGRIHPSRIEEAVSKAQQDVESSVHEAGEAAAIEAKVTGLHPELIKMLGKMRYRQSYGQNLLAHSVEVSKIGAAIAGELGANVTIVKRAGLLHDIGKIAADLEGTHALISREIMLRYGESQAAAHAAGAHHNELEMDSVEDVLVQLADSISAARPGARREPVESYINRMHKLETIAESFPGVERTFAVQSGHEVRLIVQPDIVDDQGAKKLSVEIARRIEQELEFPGQIKVTVIRDMRFTEIAK